MGRHKYTSEERDEIIRSFIRAAREIIDTEGIEHVSTRKLAKITGYNSAKLYFYFDNLDDLTTLATISYLEKYANMLAKDLPMIKNAKEFLIHSWGLFCRCAFDDPHIYYHIFFCRRHKPINDLMEEYYRLYPHQLERLDDSIHKLFQNGSLEERDYMILDAMAKDGDIKREHIKYINDFSNSYFKHLLEERMAGNGGFLEENKLLEEFMGGLKLLLELSSNSIKPSV